MFKKFEDEVSVALALSTLKKRRIMLEEDDAEYSAVEIEKGVRDSGAMNVNVGKYGRFFSGLAFFCDGNCGERRSGNGRARQRGPRFDGVRRGNSSETLLNLIGVVNFIQLRSEKVGFFFELKVGEGCRGKKIVSGKIIEIAVIIVALAIFKAFKVKLTRLALFSVVKFFTSGRNISAIFDRVGNVQLESPNDVGGVPYFYRVCPRFFFLLYLFKIL